MSYPGQLFPLHTFLCHSDSKTLSISSQVYLKETWLYSKNVHLFCHAQLLNSNASLRWLTWRQVPKLAAPRADLIDKLPILTALEYQYHSLLFTAWSGEKTSIEPRRRDSNLRPVGCCSHLAALPRQNTYAETRLSSTCEFFLLWVHDIATVEFRSQPNPSAVPSVNKPMAIPTSYFCLCINSPVHKPMGLNMDRNTSLYDHWILAFDIFYCDSDWNWPTLCSLVTFSWVLPVFALLLAAFNFCSCSFFVSCPESNHCDYFEPVLKLVRLSPTRVLTHQITEMSVHKPTAC